ncbi:MAG: HDIG domain-containing protein [Candidatus Calescibacterium sp.]|nr:HDIG domain-containing protein [Candidatus Calescibacterium sp.]MDW8132520.1 HDIG domain-containing protein [Candidatus Calescibacterium sp.]
MYLLFYFPIQPNIYSKFNIILSNDYKGYLDENEYLKKIQDIYKIKEYDIDYSIASKVIYDIDVFFSFQLGLKENFQKGEKALKDFLYQNRDKIGYFKIDISDFEILKRVNVQEMELMKKLIMEKLELHYRQGIMEDDVPAILNEIDIHLDNYVKNTKNSKNMLDYKKILLFYVAKVLFPNKFLNISKTLEKHTEMISKIPRIYSLNKGSVIVKKGQIISDEAYRIIVETGTKKDYNIKFMLYSFFISFILFLCSVSIFFISKIGLKNIFFIVIFIFVSSVMLLSLDKSFYYLIPFWVVILFSYFVNGVVLCSVSFIWYLVISNIMYYQIWGNLVDVGFFLYSLFSFLFLFYFLYVYERDRIYFLLNEFNLGFFVGIIFFIFVFFLLSYTGGLIDGLVNYFSFSLVSVIISFVISYFAILILGVGIEDIGIGKIRWLLDLNNPLLSDLSRLAPGTFNHSLRVSELAEACAKAIGANPILVKIGALYHDIGKMNRPKYFAENLVQGEKNPHDEREPYLSASIIKSHVTDGVKLAQKYNLPKIIEDFIKTHHGNTTILYFYIKAKNMQNTSKKYSFEIKEEDFKYPGPKPKTKEMLILMICDSVEAASRSLTEYSYSSIEKLTDNIVNRLIQEKQFSDVDITFKEIGIIKDTLVKNLYISYHVRLKYPSYAKKNGN